MDEKEVGASSRGRKYRTVPGQRFGRLVVIGETTGHEKGRTYWLCRCDCGAEKIALPKSIARGLTQSCGCLHKEWLSGLRATHRKSGGPTYSSWSAMRARCRNPNNKHYADYGGRGITVCARWDNFENFLADMGEKPSARYSIERRENNRGYEPDNCYWAFAKAQARNTRKSIFMEWNGQIKTLAEWAEILGLDYYKLHYHFRKRHLSASEAIAGSKR